MLYDLFRFLEEQFNLPGAGLFEYISFRSAMAIIFSLLISIVWGNRVIDFLRTMQVGETVRDLGLSGQKAKEGTPTMGGIIIIMSVLVPCILFAKLDNIYVIILIVSTLWLGLIGGIDDYIKVFQKDKSGLKSKFKLIGQCLLGLFVGLIMFFHDEIVIRVGADEAINSGFKIVSTVDVVDDDGATMKYAYVKTPLTNIPFVKNNNLNYEIFTSFFSHNGSSLTWIFFVPLVIFIVTAVSNAANLTDGLDGLAAGVSGIVALALVIFAYVSSNSQFAEYLNILFIPGTQEVVIYVSALIGGCIGFLWYNSYPAKVFMGDTGSLTLGGVIAVLSILLRKELLIPILCGIFFIEALSVTLQVSYFKYTKRRYGEGRRIFRMSPIHHHFQKLGMHEAKIVTRFWIVGVLLAIMAIVTLKLR